MSGRKRVQRVIDVIVIVFLALAIAAFLKYVGAIR